jgi:hypothetical protein
MRSRYPELEDAAAPSYIASGHLPHDHIAKTRAIREQYAQSGLYRNDGSSLPLWVVNWYSPEVAVSNDGIHLIRYSTNGVEKLTAPAFFFYESGFEIHNYQVGDLVRSTGEFKSGLFPGFKWLDSVNLDEESATLSVILMNDDRFLFDVKTGELLRVERNRKKLYSALSIGAAVVILIIALVLIIRRT